jgi:hypothetical protein
VKPAAAPSFIQPGSDSVTVTEDNYWHQSSLHGGTLLDDYYF